MHSTVTITLLGLLAASSIATVHAQQRGTDPPEFNTIDLGAEPSELGSTSMSCGVSAQIRDMNLTSSFECQPGRRPSGRGQTYDGNFLALQRLHVALSSPDLEGAERDH